MDMKQRLYNEQQLGENQGFWEYQDVDGNIVCYVVRKIKSGKKYFIPWTFQNERWVMEWMKDSSGNSLPKPIYNVRALTLFPNKPVLVVEGEKTADAGIVLFPDFNVITWMGGCKGLKSVNIDILALKDIYLLPDNDKGSFDAMELLADSLHDKASFIRLVDIRKLGVSEKWDIADIEYGEVDFEDVKQLVLDARPIKKPLNFPDLSSKDRPLNTTDNVAALLRFHNITVRYNLMTNYPEFHADGKSFSSVNEADCYFTEICNLCVKAGVPKVDLPDHLLLISDRNRYHPGINFVESKKWDGIPRVSDFIKTVKAENQLLANKLIYRWLISCIAALYTETGVSLEGVLVFQGKQKVGKTYWFMKLIPESYRYLLKTGLFINPNNKDDVIKCTSCWLGELAEIDGTIKKSDVSSQKAFISQSVDYYRVPFGRRVREVPRRTAYYGSVNPVHYLSDDTGNRRYWSVSVTSIDYDHEFDMQQVWAELKNDFEGGESYRLTNEEQDLINIENETFQSIDPLEEAIINAFRWDEEYRNNSMTCGEVMIRLGFGLTDSNISRESRKCGAILAKLTGKKGRKSHNKLVYDLPREKITG